MCFIFINFRSQECLRWAGFTLQFIAHRAAIGCPENCALDISGEKLKVVHKWKRMQEGILDIIRVVDPAFGESQHQNTIIHSLKL